MRKSSLSTSIGFVLVAATLVACGGDAEVEPVGDVAIEEAPPVAAPAPPAAGAPAAGDLPAGVTPAMVEAGRQVFVGQGLCFTCHGQEAQGTPLAPNLTDDQWLNIESPEQDLQAKLTALVRTGVAQPKEHPAPMPPMGGAQLSDDQINSVVAYVTTLAN